MNKSCNATVLLEEEYIVYSYVYPCICAIGVLCNSFNLIVLSDKAFSLSTYTYMRALTVSDMVTLIIMAFIGLSRCEWCYSPTPANYWRRVYEIYVYLPFNNMSGSVSVWLTVALAAERLVFIKYPVISKNYCTVKNARKAILILSVCGVAINYHHFFIFRINDCFQLERFSDTRTVLYHVITAQSWLKAVLVTYLSLILLIVLSVLLILEVRRPQSRVNTLSQHHKTNNARSKLQRRLTLMLIVLVIFFLLGNLPVVLAAAPIARGVFNDSTLTSATYKIYRLVSNCLEMTTFSLNFCIYCAFNKKFGQVFCRKISGHRCNIKLSPSTSNQQVSIV